MFAKSWLLFYLLLLYKSITRASTGIPCPCRDLPIALACRLPRRSPHRFLWFLAPSPLSYASSSPQRMRVDEDRQSHNNPLPPLATRKPGHGDVSRSPPCSSRSPTSGAAHVVARREAIRLLHGGAAVGGPCPTVTVASSVRRPSPAPRTRPLTLNLDRCTATTLCLSASSWPCAADLSIAGSRPEYNHLFCLLIDVSNSKGKVLQWLGISFLNIVFLGLLHAHLPAIHLLIALAFATPHASLCEVTRLSLSRSCEGGQIFIAVLGLLQQHLDRRMDLHYYGH
jgi:hypothetical protein